MNIFIEIQPLGNQSRHNPGSHSHSLSQPGCQVIVFGGFRLHGIAWYCVILHGMTKKLTSSVGPLPRILGGTTTSR